MRRPSSPCPSCGAALASEARYCPMCGHATGSIAVEEPAAIDDGRTAEVTIGAPRRRWLIAVAVVGVAALIVTVTVFNSGHAPSATAPTTVPAATVAATTTSAPTTTVPVTSTTAAVSSRVSPRPDAAGVVVYLATNQGDVLRVDLGSGGVDRRSGFAAPGDHTGPWMVMARRGGFVLSSLFDPGGVILGVSDDPGAAPTVLSGPPQDNNLGSTQVAPAAEADEVWLWNQTEDLSTILRRVRLDGTVTAGPVTIPRFASVLGADGPGAVALSGPDGMYRATVNGTATEVRSVWPRAPLAYNSSTLLDLACSPSLDCHLQMVDRSSQNRRSMTQPPPDLVSPYFDSVLSPDGAWLAHVDNRSTGPMLTVYDVRGDGTPVSHEILASSSFGPLGQPAAFGFSPDGKWLVFLGPADDVELWPVGTPQPPVEMSVPGGHDLSGLAIGSS